MAANGRGMMRPNAGGRSPPFVVIGLVVVSVILGFNYWRLSSRNTELNDQLLDLQDKLRITTLKKLSVEKRNDVCVQKIKESDSEKDRHKTSFDQCEMEKRSCRDQVASKGREYESQRIAVEECKRDLVGFPSIARLHRDLNIPVHSHCSAPANIYNAVSDVVHFPPSSPTEHAMHSPESRLSPYYATAKLEPHPSLEQGTHCYHPHPFSQV